MQCLYVVVILAVREVRPNDVEKCVKNTLREEIITTNLSQEFALAVFL
jgi:hypothetical protein